MEVGAVSLAHSYDGRTRRSGPTAGVAERASASGADGSALRALQRRAGNRAAVRLVARTTPIVIQRIEVKELTDANVGQWFVLPSKAPGQYLGVGARGMRGFRVQDDAFGPRVIELGKGDVRQLTTFPEVVDENWGGVPERYFTDNGERTERGREAREGAAAKRKDLGTIETVTMTELKQLGKRYGESAEVTDTSWNKTVVEVDKPLWTRGMGPCITVAATGLTVDREHPRRVFVLHHSFVPVESKNRELGHEIIDKMEAKVFKATGQGLAMLRDLRFYVVGGDKSSADKMRTFVTTLLFRKYDVAGVADTTDEDPGTAEKAILIAPDGKVRWATKKRATAPTTSVDDPPSVGPLGRGRGRGYTPPGRGRGFTPPGRGRGAFNPPRRGGSSSFTSARDLSGTKEPGTGGDSS